MIFFIAIGACFSFYPKSVFADTDPNGTDVTKAVSGLSGMCDISDSGLLSLSPKTFLEVCNRCGFGNCKFKAVLACIDQSVCESEQFCSGLGTVNSNFDPNDFVSCGGSKGKQAEKTFGGRDDKGVESSCQDVLKEAAAVCKEGNTTDASSLFNSIVGEKNSSGLTAKCKEFQALGVQATGSNGAAASSCKEKADRCSSACVGAHDGMRNSCSLFGQIAQSMASQARQGVLAERAAQKCKSIVRAGPIVKPTVKPSGDPKIDPSADPDADADPEAQSKPEDIAKDDTKKSDKLDGEDQSPGGGSPPGGGMPDLSSMMGDNSSPYQDSYGCQANPNSPECINCDLNPDSPSCPQKEKDKSEKGKMGFGAPEDQARDSDYNVPGLENTPRMPGQGLDPKGTGPAIQNATVANNSGGGVPGQGGGSPPAPDQPKNQGPGDKPYNISNLDQGMRSGGGYSNPAGTDSSSNSRGNGRSPSSYNNGRLNEKDQIDLQTYLPGGANDPRRVGGHGNDPSYLLPQHANMWEMQNTRISVHCRVNGHKDCGTLIGTP